MNEHVHPVFQQVLNSFATSVAKPAVRKPRYIATIEARVAGIPCQVGVIEFDRVAGSYSSNADSDLDYYGYTDCEYDILDSRGRPALWLERKVTADERQAIEDKIADYFS